MCLVLGGVILSIYSVYVDKKRETNPESDAMCDIASWSSCRKSSFTYYSVLLYIYYIIYKTSKSVQHLNLMSELDLELFVK